MKAAGAKKQTLFLTGVNALVRAMGLLLRVLLSRFMGAEIMGIAELAQGVHMLAITPLTSGLPMAISRMTARAPAGDRRKPLLAGISMVRTASVVLIPALLLLSPVIARWMGDVRVLPSLWFSAPCILILGYSAAFNGYCYGMERSLEPALSELIEQAARLLLSLALLTALSRLTAAWLAAVPVVATMLAELIGLAFVLLRLRIPLNGSAEAASWREPVLRLAAPATFSRVVQTLLRSLTAILIPLRLQASGLPAAEATSRLGMLNGMVMPILMLPCVFTSALSMVALPRIARAEDDPGELRRLLATCLASCLPGRPGLHGGGLCVRAVSCLRGLPHGRTDAPVSNGRPADGAVCPQSPHRFGHHRAGTAKALHVRSACRLRHDARADVSADGPCPASGCTA